MIEPNKQEDLLEAIASSNEAIIVLLMRIYDTHMTHLRTINSHVADKLAELHEAGKTITDLPYMVIDEDEEEQTN